ncbi:MAG: hypothetical protein V1761_03280 [bacterium]
MNKAAIKEEKQHQRRRPAKGDISRIELQLALAALIVEQLDNYEMTAVEAACLLQRIK